MVFKATVKFENGETGVFLIPGKMSIGISEGILGIEYMNSIVDEKYHSVVYKMEDVKEILVDEIDE